MIQRYTEETTLAQNKMQVKLLSNEEFYPIMADARSKNKIKSMDYLPRPNKFSLKRMCEVPQALTLPMNDYLNGNIISIWIITYHYYNVTNLPTQGAPKTGIKAKSSCFLLFGTKLHKH